MISSMMFNLDFLTILDEDDDEIFKKKELKENVIEAHFYMTDELHLLYRAQAYPSNSKDQGFSIENSLRGKILHYCCFIQRLTTVYKNLSRGN